jgi:hypothetical protein
MIDKCFEKLPKIFKREKSLKKGKIDKKKIPGKSYLENSVYSVDS